MRGSSPPEVPQERGRGGWYAAHVMADASNGQGPPVELSEDETATVLDVRRGTVKSRTARALVRLRHELELEL